VLMLSNASIEAMLILIGMNFGQPPRMPDLA